MSGADWLNFPGHPPVSVMDLVDKLRRFRGRLTKREMCVALGYSAHDPAVYKFICKLCRNYEITSAKFAPPTREAQSGVPAQRLDATDYVRASDHLKTEIAGAKKEMRRAPKYRPGPLEW